MEMPGPACKYLATTVRTPINFQPVFNFGVLFMFSRRNIGHGSTRALRTTLPFQPVQTFSTREHLPRGEKLLVPPTRNTVSCVICIRLEPSRIAANNCNFHPSNGDGKLRVELWIRIVGSLRVSSLRNRKWGILGEFPF